MKYIKKSEESIRTYNVEYDKEKLTALLNDIIRNVSYRTTGIFDTPYGSEFKDNRFTRGATLPNGDPMFEEIKRIYYYTSRGSYSYHNDSSAVEGKKVIIPELAEIINEIISENPEGIDKLLMYPNNVEVIQIDERIINESYEVDKISNLNAEMKIEALKGLRKLLNAKRNKQYFDTTLLNKYYNEAISIISLQLVEETIIKPFKKILLKDLK